MTERAHMAVRVFVASPGDVAEERRRLATVVERLGRSWVAREHGLTVELLRWEDVAPDVGRPQGVIFRQLPAQDWDIFVGILWQRFGSDSAYVDPATGERYQSGTEEEFQAAYRRRVDGGGDWPKVMLYHCTRPSPESNQLVAAGRLEEFKEWVEQVTRVKQFLDQTRAGGAHEALVTTYAEPDEFERLLREHLEVALGEFGRARGTRPAGVTPRAPARREEPWGDRRVLEDYVEVLVRDLDELQPGGIKQTKVQVALPLEEVYIGLRANRERLDIDRRIMQEELDEIRQNLESYDDPAERDRQYELFARQMRVLEQAISMSGGERIELADIVQTNPKLVILGDPGAGKTTLVRYLALRYARAIYADTERFLEALDWWAPERGYALGDLGTVRLPVLLRIAKFAEARDPRRGGNPQLSLHEYLPRHLASLEADRAGRFEELIAHFLRSGRCLVLLDGLDEIVDYGDRREITRSIAQFAGVHGTRGLPDLGPETASASSQATGRRASRRPPRRALDDPGFDVDSIAWDPNVPEEARQRWRALLSNQSPAARASLIALECRHMGNHFIVTSRVAGYQFAPLGGEFEPYTIQPMDRDEIRRFLESWCPAVERRISVAGAAADPTTVEARARREIEGITGTVDVAPGVHRLAQNPLLLRILAIIHRNEGHLPRRRAELYDTATVTLLRDWQLERGLSGAVIDEPVAVSLLGPVAMWIHEHRPTAHIERVEVLRLMAEVHARHQGKDPDNPPPEIRQAVEDFLDKVRQHSGLFVERGENLYGFMHLTFEEFFAARHMVRSVEQARTEILGRLHQPRWREPTLLAVGLLSRTSYEDAERLLRDVMEAGSPFESVLHRDLLFTAACITDSAHVSHQLRREVAVRLLSVVCDREGSIRFSGFRDQVRQALVLLCEEAGVEAVEEAVATGIRQATERPALEALLELVPLLSIRSHAVTDALMACADPVVAPVARRLAAEMEALRRRSVDHGEPALGGPDVEVARTAGFMAAFGPLAPAIRIPSADTDDLNRTMQPLMMVRTLPEALGIVEQLDAWDGEESTGRLELARQARRFYYAAPSGMPVEQAAWRLFSVLEQDPSASDPAVEIQQFRTETLALAAQVAEGDGRQLLEQTGRTLLARAPIGHAIRDALAASAGRLGVLDPWPSPEEIEEREAALQDAMVASLLGVLGTAGDSRDYLDATYYLGATSADASRVSRVWNAIRPDLEGADRERRLWALHALRQQPFLLPESEKQVVASVVSAGPDEAQLVVDLLFSVGPTPELLRWVWAQLRTDDRGARRALVAGLAGIDHLPATDAMLAAVDEALSDPALGDVAHDLLWKLGPLQHASFLRVLGWLGSADPRVRHLAALALASQPDDPVTLAREVFAEAARSRWAGGRAASSAWAALARDPSVVRLLGGLWLDGWDSILTLLWVRETPQSYIDREHPTDEWSDTMSHPESEQTVAWLLERAEYGEALIPLFQEAARGLRRREGTTTTTRPDPAFVAAVGARLTRQLGAVPEWAGFAQASTLRAALRRPRGAVGMWARRTLGAAGLSEDASLADVAHIALGRADAEVRAAAALTLLARDLVTEVVAVLWDALESEDDRVRRSADARLTNLGAQFGGRSLTDGSTEVVDWLYRASSAARGYAGTVSADATASLRFDSIYWPERWLARLRDEERDEESAEGQADPMATIHQAAPHVVAWLCHALTDRSRSGAARAAVLQALWTLLREGSEVRMNEEVCTALVEALSDPEPDVRDTAVPTLRWLEGPLAGRAAHALLPLVSPAGEDRETRSAALGALGALLRSASTFARQHRETAPLTTWLYANASEPVLGLVGLAVNSNEYIAAADSAAALDALAELEVAALGRGPVDARTASDWTALLRGARRRWTDWRAIDTAVATPALEASLDPLDKQMRRNAAAALACLHHGDDDIFGRLRQSLGSAEDVLLAMLDAASDEGYWVEDDGTGKGDYHYWYVRQLATWVEGQPPDESAWLLDQLLRRLDRLTRSFEPGAVTDEDFEQTSWPARCVVNSVLAELSERRTPRLFARGRQLTDVIAFLVRAGADPQDWRSRRAAVRTLGNLQQFTIGVADVLFAACRDVGPVYLETTAAAGRFKTFGPGSLERLSRAAADPSSSVAYRAAQLLAELGLQRSEELGADGRRRIAQVLDGLLRDRSCDRAVYDFTEQADGRLIGPLSDTIYEALARVVAGPDATGGATRAAPAVG